MVKSSSIPTVFVVRHGERLDHVDKLWQPDPSLGLWDPPLSQKGFQQAERTGSELISLLSSQQIDIDTTDIIVYSSPFQRCVDTSIGIAKGLQHSHKLKKPPILRLDLGLGEWMCERFFDDVCPAAHLMSRQQEKLARRQAHTYSMMARNQLDSTTLPPIHIDYAYTSDTVEFDYPERYTDMIQRFEYTRLHCLDSGKEAVVIFVTHAVGVNALLDGFRNKVTIPLESSYCSISCVRKYYPHHDHHAIDSNSDQSDEEGYITPTQHNPWIIESAMSDSHLATL